MDLEGERRKNPDRIELDIDCITAANCNEDWNTNYLWNRFLPISQ